MLRSCLILASLVLVSATLGQAKPPAKAPAVPPAPPGPPKTLKQMIAPTLISLKCQGVSSRQAQELLEKELGFSLEANYPEQRTDDAGKITCNFTSQPLWTVIRDVCKQGDLRVSGPMAQGASPFALALRREENRDLMYFSAKQDLALVPTVTEFRYPRRYSEATRQFENDRTRLQVTLSMLAEPKVFIAGYKRAVEIEQAIDEAGNSLVLPPDPGMGGIRPTIRARGGTAGGTAMTYASVPRHNEFPTFYPSIRPPAKMIKRLRGSATLVFGFDIVTHDFSQVTEGKPAEILLGRNGSIVISNLRRPQDSQRSYRMDITVPHVRLPNNNYTDETLEFRSMRFLLTDEQGNRFQYYGAYNGEIRGQEATYSAHFYAPYVNGQYSEGRPTKLTCVMPTRLEETVVPFDFTDMPLTEPKVDQPGNGPGGPGGGPGNPGDMGNPPGVGNDKSK